MIAEIKLYKKPAFILTGLVLVCCSMCSGSAVSCWSSLLCMGLFFVFLYNEYPIVFVRYLHYVFGSTASIFGCAVTEFFKIKLNELNDDSAFHGSLPMLVISWLVFLTALTLHDNKLSKHLAYARSDRRKPLKDTTSPKCGRFSFVMFAASCIGCILIFYTYIKVFASPAFKLGMDRFDYSKNFDFGFFYKQSVRFIRYLIIPCIVVAIYKNNKIGWSALAVYCLHSFWIGEKFGSFFSLLCTFTMIFSNKISDRVKDIKKIIALLMVLVVGLVGVAVFAVSFTRNEGASNYLLPRIAQQGQLWWKTYDKSSSYHIAEFGDEIESIRTGDAEIGNNVGAKYGIYKIMYYTTPKTQVDAKLKSGSRYTEAGFAAAYYYLGIPGCILFAVIGGILVSTFVNYFLYYLRYGQYVRAFIHFRLYTNMAVLMSMFIFFPFFNKTSILSYIILIAWRNKIFKFGNEQV